MTPLGSFVFTTAGVRGGVAPGPGGHALLGVPLAQAGGPGEPGGAERGQLQELATVDGALRGRRHGFGATVRWEGLHTRRLPLPFW